VTIAVCASPAGGEVDRSSDAVVPLLHPASTAAETPRLSVDIRRVRGNDTTSSPRTEHSGEQRSLNRAGPNYCAQVQRRLLADVEPPGFVRGTQRVHDQAAGDQHEDQAGGPEEPRQIQPHPAAVDAVPEGDCRHDAQERAEPSQRPARALVERRERAQSRSPRA
jgi:hypothetical protein